MSRNTSSSAPWSEYAAPSSTGSPTSRRPRKRTPLTTRPAATSRHGIRRGRGTAPPPGSARRPPLFSGWNWQPTNEPSRTSATLPSDHAVAAGVPRRTSARSRTRRARRPPPSPYAERAPREAHRAAGHEPEPVDAAVLLGVLECELQAEADAEDRPVRRKTRHAEPRRGRVRADRPSPRVPTRRRGAPRGRRPRRRRDLARRAERKRSRRTARCRRRSAQIATFTAAPSSTGARALLRDGVAKRTSDRLECGLGNVVRIAAGRLDVDRGARRLRKAREHVPGHSGVMLDLQLGVGAPAEIDRRACERIVHRHDGVAVAGDVAPRPERGVERRTERERGILGGVVVAGLAVTGAFEHQVEAGVEGELLEKVIVEAGAGGDADAALTVECEARREARLRRRADGARAAPSFRRRPRPTPRAARRRPRDRAPRRGSRRATRARRSRAAAVSPSACPSSTGT